jgi:hypothetical protein
MLSTPFDEWGEAALIATVRASDGALPAEIIARIMQAADDFAAGAPQHDDMARVVARVLKKGGVSKDNLSMNEQHRVAVCHVAVRHATILDPDLLVPVFDAYRRFLLELCYFSGGAAGRFSSRIHTVVSQLLVGVSRTDSHPQRPIHAAAGPPEESEAGLAPCG